MIEIDFTTKPKKVYNIKFLWSVCSNGYSFTYKDFDFFLENNFLELLIESKKYNILKTEVINPIFNARERVGIAEKIIEKYIKEQYND